MPGYEYKVVPAPTKGQKAKGVKTPQGRFAQGLQQALNAEGGDGWEYLRAELLPSEERSGLTGSTTNWRNVLVFRRAIGGADMVRPPEIAVKAPASEAAPKVAPEPVREVPQVRVQRPDPAPVPIEKTGTAENLITVSGMFSSQKSRNDAGTPEDEAFSASDEGPVERA